MYNINNNNDNYGIILLVRLRKRKRSHNESLPTFTTTSSSSFRTRKHVGRRRRILLHISITFVATTMCITLPPPTIAAMKYMNHNNNMLDSIWRMVRMPPKRSIVVIQLPPPLRCTYPQLFYLQRGGGNRLENDEDIEEEEDDDDELLPVSDECESSLNDEIPSIQERPSKEESVKTNRYTSNNDTGTEIKGKHQQPHSDLESKLATTTATATETVVHESDAEDYDEIKEGVTHDGDHSIRLSDIASETDMSVLRESSSESESSIPLQQLSTQKSQQQPNSIYRFLLRQGHYGAVIVICFVFLTEWLTLYVPPIMKLLLWIMSHIIPYTNNYFNSDDDDTSIYRRKKMSRKERKLQTKYDDAMALQQLQRLENKKAVIYRYVSDDFLQRHAIGPYSKTKLETLQDVTKFIRKTNPTTKKSVDDHTEMDIAEEEEEEDDIDWVVEALTAKQPNNHQNDSSQKRPIPVVQPSISIGIGSNQSPSIVMGLSIDFGTSKMKQIDRRRNVIAQAITAETKIRRPSSSSSSNNGNTDSILDKFRAVTGTDSVLLSRTLFGAYPGDAVPISEAANPNGVMELAQKYGYGDWSDDDDEDDNDDMTVISPTKKTTKTSQRKKKLKPLVHGSKESNMENDSWKKQDTTHSSQSKSISLSFSLNNNSDRKRQQQPPHLKPRRSNIANDKLGNDQSVIRNANEPPSPVSSSSNILQRHRNNNNKFPTKSTKVYAATELLSNKHKELYSPMEE